MDSIDNVMNVVTWLFLELLSGDQLHTWNFSLHTAMKLKFLRNKFGTDDSVQFAEQVLRKKSCDQVNETIYSTSFIIINVSFISHHVWKFVDKMW